MGATNRMALASASGTKRSPAKNEIVAASCRIDRSNCRPGRWVIMTRGKRRPNQMSIRTMWNVKRAQTT